MKFTRTTYPQYPGHPEWESPCWKLQGRLLDIDADWNTKFPFGTSFSLSIGRGSFRDRRQGFLLDLNPPLGEPNRLYADIGPWRVTLGLLSFRSSRPTGEETGGVPVWEDCLTWPHLDGIGRNGRFRCLTIERITNGPQAPARPAP